MSTTAGTQRSRPLPRQRTPTKLGRAIQGLLAVGMPSGPQPGTRAWRVRKQRRCLAYTRERRAHPRKACRALAAQCPPHENRCVIASVRSMRRYRPTQRTQPTTQNVVQTPTNRGPSLLVGPRLAGVLLQVREAPLRKEPAQSHPPVVGPPSLLVEVASHDSQRCRRQANVQLRPHEAPLSARRKHAIVIIRAQASIWQLRAHLSAMLPCSNNSFTTIRSNNIWRSAGIALVLLKSEVVIALHTTMGNEVAPPLPARRRIAAPYILPQQLAIHALAERCVPNQCAPSSAQPNPHGRA